MRSGWGCRRKRFRTGTSSAQLGLYRLVPETLHSGSSLPIDTSSLWLDTRARSLGCIDMNRGNLPHSDGACERSGFQTSASILVELDFSIRSAGGWVDWENAIRRSRTPSRENYVCERGTERGTQRSHLAATKWVSRARRNERAG